MALCKKHPEANGARGKNGHCVVCAKEYAERYRAENYEKMVNSQREYYARNKEKRRSASKVYRDANKEKIAASFAAYAEKNKEKLSEKHKEYYANNRDRKAKNFALWSAKNKDRLKEKNIKWRENNPARSVALCANYKATKRKAKPDWANDFFIQEAYALAKLREEKCGGEWHVDHIVPLRSSLVCGLHCENNLAVVRAEINRKKSNRYWPQMPEVER